MKTYFNLPHEVVFCKKCVISNQRPCSHPEFKHTRERAGAKYMHIDDDGICDACKNHEIKEQTDWDSRENDLLQLLDKHRSKNGEYDCIIPGSGGKDSAMQAHLLKDKYGMNPLTVTWSPIMYTDYGYENWKNWIEIGGFDNVSIKANGHVMKTLTRLSLQNLLHPFQTFMYGQKNLMPKIAAKFGIPLIFYGESEVDYGNSIAETSALRDKYYWCVKDYENIYLGGVSLEELKEVHGLDIKDLNLFLPPTEKEINNQNIEVRYLGHYIKWVPQEAYYYSVEHTGFKARPFRTQGTYSKYNSIDDKIDDLHYYTTYIKYGLGRASYDASQEIRNKHITREEGVALVERFDGEFPDKYFNEVMEYIEMEPEEFHKLCDEFRSPHLWRKDENSWVLKTNVNQKKV